jgi:hypothetical protein
MLKHWQKTKEYQQISTNIGKNINNDRHQQNQHQVLETKFKNYHCSYTYVREQ